MLCARAVWQGKADLLAKLSALPWLLLVKMSRAAWGKSAGERREPFARVMPAARARGEFSWVHRSVPPRCIVNDG